MNSESALLLGAILPGVNAALLAIYGRRLPGVLCGWLSVAAATASASCFILLASVQGVATANWIAAPGEWIRFGAVGVGALQASMALSADQLGLAMALLVSIAGTLIALYSIQYMEHDENSSRYFAGFSLFLTAMLILVLADNIFLTFVGWEGVGLASYLLIGHYWKESFAPPAAWKAFFTNRIGDVFFLLGAFLLYRELGAADYVSMEANFKALDGSEALNSGRIVIAAFFLLGGIAGKSAQIPLHVWLPDAMAGPTPVSALIHAATMVTAGVYLAARLSWVFVAAPVVQAVLLIAAIITLLLGSVLAAYQADIKRALAYSTLANLGLMFVAHASSAPRAAMEHLFAHAAFKALLFLAAGSIIHFAHHEQNLHRLKGVLRRMPVTRVAFWVGAIGSVGALPFASASFYSKEAILQSLAHSQFVAGPWGIAGASAYWLVFAAELITVLYTFRLLGYLESNPDDSRSAHWRESGVWIRLTLVALSVAAVAGGIARGMGWLEKSFYSGWGPELHADSDWLHALVFVALAVAVFANFATPSVRSRWQRYVRWLATPRGPLERNFYFDDINRKLLAEPLLQLARTASAFADPESEGGAPGMIGQLMLAASGRVRRLLAGLLNEYAAWMAAAAAAGLAIALWLSGASL
ncbi:MAG: NADH-quinone oxidoreductase subunit L [Leptospirales bacterium]|nr:NADH-quinone oxidoreductase subunit L [Leptospirales bacterium]